MYPQFDPIWPWAWVAIAAVASLVVVIATYRQRIAHLSPGQRRLLMGLRICTWAILTLAMLRPWFEITEIDRHASVYVVACDDSRSMSVRDGPAGATRRETVLKLLDEHRKELANLGADIEILYVDFAREAGVVKEFTAETP